MNGQLESGCRRELVAIVGGVTLLLGGILFFFDPTVYHFYPTCVFHQMTGLLCPGCGGLRAIHQILHGHLLTAFRFNPLLVSCVPVIAVIAASHGLRDKSNRPRSMGFPMSWIWLVGATTLVLGVWRNLPGAPTTILPP